MLTLLGFALTFVLYLAVLVYHVCAWLWHLDAEARLHMLAYAAGGVVAWVVSAFVL